MRQYRHSSFAHHFRAQEAFKKTIMYSLSRGNAAEVAAHKSIDAKAPCKERYQVEDPTKLCTPEIKAKKRQKRHKDSAL